MTTDHDDQQQQNRADAEVRALPPAELAAALVAAAGPEDNARRGAVHLLVGFGDLSLIRLHAVRQYVVSYTEGPLVQWPALGRHLDDVAAPDFNPDRYADDDRRRGLLDVRSSSALDALRLAASLGDGSYRVNLRSPAGRFGTSNRLVVVEALAIAFGIRPGTVMQIPGKVEAARA